MPTAENSLVPVTHSLFSQGKIRFYWKFLKAARFSLSLSRQFLCQQSWHVPAQFISLQRRSLPATLTLVGNTFDYSQRSFKGRINVLYFGNDRIQVEDCTHCLPIKAGQSQAHEKKGCFRGRRRKKEGIPVVDFDRYLAACQCVFDGASFKVGRGSVFQD